MTGFFNALKGAYNEWIVPETLSVSELQEGTKQFGEFDVTSTHTPHTDTSLAYRIEEKGKSMVYSGDTDYSESLIELAKDTDLLVIECSLPDDESKREGHLTPGEVIEIVNKSHAKKVVVTHLYPVCDEINVVDKIRKNVGVDVIEAHDLLEIEI